MKIDSEKAVKREVKKILDKYSWFWFMPPANGFGRSGISDILAIRHGVFLAIETKYGPNKPTPMQKAFLESVRAEGGFGFVVNETNLEWLDRFLECFSSATVAVAQHRGDDKEKAVDPSDGADMLNAIAALTVML